MTNDQRKKLTQVEAPPVGVQAANAVVAAAKIKIIAIEAIDISFILSRDKKWERI